MIALFALPHAHAGVPQELRAESTRAAASVTLVQHVGAPHWGAASQQDLRNAVRAALSNGVSGARGWSCVVISADGKLLYDDGGDHAVEPASAQKLIVTDAALTELGPQYRFDTFYAETQAPLNGVLSGDLWLVGSGDPSLRSNDLRDGIARLKSGGIDRIAGRLVVDPSAIAGEEINPLWNAADANEDFMAATSGISIDEDTVEFDVTGTADGDGARVQVRPQSPGVHYSGEIATGGGDDVVIAGTENPNEFRIYGDIPAGVTEKYWLPVHGIPQYAAGVADRMLRDDRIGVEQPPITGTVPLDAQIVWEHRSAPLLKLLHHMLVRSDNHFAEQFMRTLGAQSGATADDRNGLANEATVLRDQGIPVPGLHLVDGSGLAHADRVAAITLARILWHFEDLAGGNALYALLPRGGKDGTLKDYQFTMAAGRVRAKSGHLSDAASLAGYVNTRRHGRVIFAFMINGSPGDPDAAIVSAVDQIAER